MELNYFTCQSPDWATLTISILSCLATWVTAFFAGVALNLSRKEYCNYRKREKTSLMNRYNERYCENEDIKNVIKYLLHKQNTPKTGFGEDMTEENLEMFLRFFEEIQHSIEADLLDKDEVREMLAFYAALAYEDKKIKKYVEKEKGNWTYYLNFIKDIKLTDNDKKTLHSLPRNVENKNEEKVKTDNNGSK